MKHKLIIVLLAITFATFAWLIINTNCGKPPGKASIREAHKKELIAKAERKKIERAREKAEEKAKLSASSQNRSKSGIVAGADYLSINESYTDASYICNDYKSNEIRARSKWEDRKLIITGKITSIGQSFPSETPYIVLDYCVQYYFENKSSVYHLNKGDVITIEGKTKTFVLGNLQMYETEELAEGCFITTILN